METAEKRGIPLEIVYLNCKMKRDADTEYRVIAQLCNIFGKAVPATGLPTDEVYKSFVNTIEEKNKLIILVLDEIDQLVEKAGDGILYNLTRLNSELKRSQISIIGISNDLVFVDNIDPRIKSSLSEEELVFPPYDAREHGDARRALELLRVSGEVAERKNKLKIDIKHLDEAEEKIERDRIVDIITTQPKQSQLTLHSIFSLNFNGNKGLFTGDVYDIYKNNCNKCGLKPLTQRRVSDIIAELDMLGVINAKVISKGRYGRTREISLAIPDSSVNEVKEILLDSLNL